MSTELIVGDLEKKAFEFDRVQFRWFGKNVFEFGLRLDAYEIFFRTRYDGRHGKAQRSNTRVNDLDLHSKSQGYEKADTFAIVLL